MVKGVLFLTQLFKNRRMSSFHFRCFAAQRCQRHLENLLTQSVLCSRNTEDSQCPSAHPGSTHSIVLPSFFYFFLCLIIFISPWTLTCKKGAISELSVQRLYLHSANVGVSQYAALSRQFSQRPNVINGCHLRGAEWGWKRKRGGEEKSHPKEIVAWEKNGAKSVAARFFSAMCFKMTEKGGKKKASMSLSKFFNTARGMQPSNEMWARVCNQ